VSEISAPGHVAQPSDADRKQAFLLHILATAPGRKLLRGQLAPKLKTKAAQALGLEGLPEVFADLEAAGLVRKVKVTRSLVYELTDAGAARLAEVKDLVPAKPGRGGTKPPANEQVSTYRTGYLLLQVLRSRKCTVTEAEANKSLDTYAREGLELNVATAQHLRRDLVTSGLLAVQGNGRSATYSLTPAGWIALGNIRFENGRRQFRFPGEMLNRLLEAAREVGKQFTATTPSIPPVREELERAILATFGELRREQHSTSGLVPIHEVRTAIRQQFGDSAARHDVFDEGVLGLWRAKKLRLIPITDLSKATPDQIQDAIPGVGETLFYLEAAHATAPV
jgi:predicted transcriptional regulator